MRSSIHVLSVSLLLTGTMAKNKSRAYSNKRDNQNEKEMKHMEI